MKFPQNIVRPSTPEGWIGLTEEAALAKSKAEGTPFRVGSRDGEVLC